MSYTEEELMGMRKEDLRVLASEELNIDFAANMAKPDIVAEMMVEFSRYDEIPGQKGAAPASGSDEVDHDKFVDPIKLEGDRITIRIPEGAGPDGSYPVKLSVNGRAYLIPRGQEEDVPKFLLKALNDAKTTAYNQVTNKDGSIETKSRQVPRFPYEIVGAI